MAYTKRTWTNSSGLAINATNLNYFEDGIAQALPMDGSSYMSGQLKTTNGALATPAIAPNSDTNTGIYFPLSDTMAFVEGGAEAMRLDSSGNFVIGDTTALGKLSAYGTVTTDTLNHGLCLGVSTSTTIAQGIGSGILFQSRDSGNNKRSAAGIDVSKVGTNSATYVHDLRFFTHNGSAFGERMRIGATGSIGINTTSPAAQLHVKGGGVNNLRVETTVTRGGGANSIELWDPTGQKAFLGYFGGSDSFYISNDLATDMIFQNNGSVRMRVTSGGSLLIAYSTSQGAYPLQVNGQIFATSSTIATSDVHYKDNVQPLFNALSIVNQLNPVQFDWKQHPIHNFNRENPTVGFIAQEVKEVLKNEPYLNSIIKKSECQYEKDGEIVKEEFLGIAESNLIAILTKAVQELSVRVTDLESRLT